MILRPTPVSLRNCPCVRLWQWWATRLKRVIHSAFPCIHKKPAVLLLWGSWVRHAPWNRKGGWVMEETPEKLSPAPTLAPSPCRALLTRHLLQAPTCLLYPEQLTWQGPPPRHTRPERFLFLCGSLSAYPPQNIRTGTLLLLALWSQNPEQCLAHT